MEHKGNQPDRDTEAVRHGDDAAEQVPPGVGHTTRPEVAFQPAPLSADRSDGGLFLHSWQGTLSVYLSLAKVARLRQALAAALRPDTTPPPDGRDDER